MPGSFQIGNGTFNNGTLIADLVFAFYRRKTKAYVFHSGNASMTEFTKTCLLFFTRLRFLRVKIIISHYSSYYNQVLH